MAKKPTTTNAEGEAKDPGPGSDAQPEAGETNRLALTLDDLEEAIKKPRVVTKWYLHRREQFVAPGGRIVYNLVFEVVQPKRDPVTQRVVETENVQVFEGPDKFIGAMTLAYVKPEKAECFEVGKEYTFEFLD